MYAVIRHYHHDPKYSNEINEKIITDFLPLIKKIDGFLSHYRIDNGQGEIAPIFLEHPEIMEGDVVIHD